MDGPGVNRVGEHLVSVVVADPQPMFRDALSRVVRQCARFQLVAEAADGRLTLELLRRHRPDVAVLAPNLSGLTVTHLLRVAGSEGLKTRMIIIGVSSSHPLAYELVELGAAGCLTTAASGEQVRDAIIAVAAGGAYVEGELQDSLFAEIRMRALDERVILSEREREVLRRVAAGESAPAIGRAMHLSLSTVKTHLGHLYGKLEVSERAEAVAVAMRRGLLD
jgi:two-component system nitrate/nitrite response regulator NarL